MSSSCIQDVVHALMDARSMNVNQLARASGLPPSTVYTFFKAERRGHNVHHTTAAKLAKGLDVPVGVLLGEQREQDVANLLAAWSTLDGPGRETLLAIAMSLCTAQSGGDGDTPLVRPA